MKNIWLWALVAFALFAGTASAAPQLQGYNVTPSLIKPGATGTLSISIYNPSSTEYLSGAEISASGDQVDFSGGSSLGDIGTLGTSLASLPFKVRPDAKPGNYAITLTLAYYSNLGGTSSGYKKFSIPFTISPTLLLQLDDVNVSKSPIQPGDSFTVQAILDNQGGPLHNMILSYADDSNFTFDGQAQIRLGDLDAGQKTPITLNLVAKNAISAGYYSIPFVLKYDDAVSAGKTDTLMVGPISALSQSTRITVSAQTQTLSPGQTEEFVVVVKNTGTDTLTDVHVRLPDSSTFFVPLDFGEKVIPSIEAGKEASVSFEIVVNSNAELKAYSIPLTISYQGKTLAVDQVSKIVGVRVAGKPELSIIASTTPAPLSVNGVPYKLSIQVSNTGNTAVRALSLYVTSDVLEFLGNNNEYMGTLNLDDYSTSQFTVAVKSGTAPGTYPVNVRVTYKDAYNAPYEETHVAQIEVVSAEVAALARGPAASNPLYTLVLLVVVAVVLYFVYRKFLKPKKPVKG